ncbi:hypothetical protein PENTCL1PPCAC_20251, partial [Pristionchus entomophagus]
IYSMHFLLATVSLLAVVSGVASQCTGRDSSNCATFTRNGFCTNARNTLDVRKRFCGVACGFCNKPTNLLKPNTFSRCGLCNRQGTEIGPRGGPNNNGRCVDANNNCRVWAVTRNFCVRPDVSNAFKLEVCCRTCRPIIRALTTSTRVTAAPTEAPTAAATTEIATDAPT